MQRSLTPHQVAALLLAFFSFFMAAMISRHTFERLPHLEDELAYLFQARVFADGRLTATIEQPSRAFWQPFVLTDSGQGTRFGKYSPGWPALLSLGVRGGQPWLVNALMGLLSVVLVYRLGREVFGPDVGLVAAALVAFSPMALLLNATLMGHSAALCCLLTLIYAFWRIEACSRQAWRWGLLGGLALGILVVNRPLTAVAATAPLIIWGAVWLARQMADALRHRRVLPGFRARAAAFLLLAVLATIIALFIPVYNHAATGDARENLYLRVWPYDRVGFGEGYGRNGHTIVKGVAHARYDLSMTAADLFGWAIGRFDDAVRQHLQREEDYLPLLGLSLFLIPVGLWFGMRPWWLRLWLLIGLAWLLPPLIDDARFLIGLPQVIDASMRPTLDALPLVPTDAAAALVRDDSPLRGWLAQGIALLLLPAFVFALQPGRAQESGHRARWAYLLFTVAAALIVVHLAYWVGSQRYSTRYYFEGLGGLAILGGVAFVNVWHGFSHIVRRFLPQIPQNQLAISGYGLLALLLIWGFASYSLPRINALHDFNRVSQGQIAQVEARRTGDAPVLVIVETHQNTALRWRSYGALMANTDPRLTNDIIAAWDFAPASGEARQALLARFPDHQVIELRTFGEEAWFADCYDGRDPYNIPPACDLHAEP